MEVRDIRLLQQPDQDKKHLVDIRNKHKIAIIDLNKHFCNNTSSSSRCRKSRSSNRNSNTFEHNTKNKTSLSPGQPNFSELKRSSVPQSTSTLHNIIPPITKAPNTLSATTANNFLLTTIMNSPHHPHHEHHDVHQQRLLWFFSFCNQRSSSSSSGSSNHSGPTTRRGVAGSRKKSASSNRNKFALQYQQQLQQQQKQSSCVFGCDLIDHTRIYSDEDSIPHIVKSCTRFIEKYGIIFGIYRLSGMRVNINKLRQDFDKNPKISMIDNEAISNDAHAVACVLKQYFRELPIPLLTFQMYERFIELFKHRNNNSNNNNTSNNNNNDDSNIDLIDDDHKDDAKHDTTYVKDIATVTTTNQNTLLSKSKSSSAQQSVEAVDITKAKVQNQQQFATSVSDSQLISLSSVVTTTTSDVKYQVRLDDLRKLLLQLPKAHYQTLRFLMRHLACIAANGQKTGMDSKNVAIVWAPNLLKPRELELSAGLETLQVIGLQAVITEQLIKHHKFLFDDFEDETVQSTASKVISYGRTEVLDIDKIEDTENINSLQNSNQPQQKPKQTEPMHTDQEKTSKEKTDNQDIKERDENEENNF